MSETLSDDQQSEIDRMSLVEMLGKWRFAPAGTFQNGAPWAEYFQQSMAKKRVADPGGWVAASKSVG